MRNAVITVVKQSTIESKGFDVACQESWKIAKNNSHNLKYVISLVNGKVAAVWSDLVWKVDGDRLAFDGKIDANLTNELWNQQVSRKYSRKGLRNPVRYCNISTVID